jgi:dienelactone hydrolase
MSQFLPNFAPHFSLAWLPAAALSLALGGCSMANAGQNNAEPPLDARLNEQVVMLPAHIGDRTVELQTTIFKPAGPGPFPMVVLNHGKNPGKARDQKRSRHLRVAAALVERGYVVAIPMREGFAGSEGRYPDDHCDIYKHGLDEARDVAAAINELVKLPYVDRKRIVIAGQSDGGLTTIALGTKQIPGVLGLVNFSGGLRVRTCSDWPQRLVATYAAYGKQARYPSLWFYGDNDQNWPQPMPQQMFSAYHSHTIGAAHEAKMVDIGVFGKNSHVFFDAKDGVKLWLPQATVFFHSLGLPFEPVK